MRIVIITLGSRGDLQPYVALGKGLQRAGHLVRVATHARFEEFVRGEGLDFAALGGDPSALVASMTDQVEPSQRRLWLPRRLSAVRDSMRAGRSMSAAVMRDIPEMTESSWKASQDADALVLSTFAAFTTGIPTARKRGLPAFVAHPFPLVPTAEFSAVGLPAAPRWLAVLRPWYNLMSGKATERFFSAMYAKHSKVAQQILGLPVLPPRKQLRELGTPTLYEYSPSFLPPPADWPERNCVTGYWFFDAEKNWQPTAALRDFLGAGPPPVYIGFGSVIRRSPQELTDIVLAAVERSRQRAILMTGGALTAGPVTDDIFTLESVPHDWLFPRVAAVVHHGGAGTTGAGLRAGKPTLIVPFTADQPFWGNRVHERGVGPKPIAPRQLSAETLAEGIQIAVTDPQIHAKAQALGEKIRAEDGIGVATAIISRTLRKS